MRTDGKHAGNLLDKNQGPEWLRQYRTRHVPTLENSRDEQYGRRSSESGKAGREFQAIHTGEQNVRHDQCELAVQAAGDGKGLLPVFSREDREALSS